MSRETPPLPTLEGYRWLHRKTGGVYRVEGVGYIEATMTPCVVYRADTGGPLFVRPFAEFTDGRFQVLSDYG